MNSGSSPPTIDIQGEVVQVQYAVLVSKKCSYSSMDRIEVS